MVFSLQKSTRLSSTTSCPSYVTHLWSISLRKIWLKKTSVCSFINGFTDWNRLKITRNVNESNERFSVFVFCNRYLHRSSFIRAMTPGNFPIALPPLSKAMLIRFIPSIRSSSELVGSAGFIRETRKRIISSKHGRP